MTEQGLARLNVEGLIQQAIANNAGVEQLERLFELSKNVRAEQAREFWHGSMADFQRLCPVIKKTASARIATSRANYSYSYAPLDEILSTIQPIMGQLGLSISWRSRVEHNSVVVNCRVAHKYGHYEESGEICMPVSAAEGSDRGANAAQRVAIALTYGKRYSLLGIIGKVGEDDDDGQVGPVELRGQTPPAKTQTPDQNMRDELIAQIGELADTAGWDNTQRLKIWQETFGDVKPHQVDPAALADFLAEVRKRVA